MARHPVEGEALSGLVRDDVGYSAGHAGGLCWEWCGSLELKGV